MIETRNLKDNWNELAVKLYEKLGVMEINEESICISSMLASAIIENKPLTKNEIETIECIIHSKMFKNGLL